MNVTKLYRALKSIQGFVLFAIGIVFCIFFQKESVHNALSMCIAVAILIYGLSTIAFSYLFERGIASTDMISGIIMSSFGIFIFIEPDIITKYLPLLFGIVLLTYSLIILIETIIYIFNKNTIKSIIYSFTFVIFVIGGVLITIYSLKDDILISNTLTLIIGIILALIGLALGIYALISPKKDIIVTKNSPASGKEIALKNDVISKEKTAKIKQKTKTKEKPLELEDKSSTKGIEDKSSEEIND